MKMDDKTLRKLQKCEAEILSRVDSFCSKHNIKYSLYAGTALGAVRHKGFIPWDDDIDICMERSEYERFIAEWDKDDTIKDLFFQDPEDDESRINHAKIRKDGTILASNEEARTSGHHGIWIDIFPMDKVPLQSKSKKIFLFVSKIRLVYTRGYTVKNKGWFMRLLSGTMLIIPRKLQIKIRKKCDSYIKKNQDSVGDYCLMSLTAPEDLKIEFPLDMFNSTHSIQFEGYQFQITDNDDEMLRLEFGDYWQLPPEEERVCKHHPEVLLFGDEEDTIL